jgi:hypothetical protein
MKQTSAPLTPQLPVTGPSSASSWVQTSWSRRPIAAVVIDPTNTDQR